MRLPFLRKTGPTNSSVVDKKAEETFRRQMEMLITVNSAIASSLKLDEILQVTVNEMVKTMGYFGGVIFLVDKEEQVLRSKTVSETWYTKAALKFIQSSFESLYVPLEEDSNNLAVQTVLKKENCVSPNLGDFVVPAVSDSVASALQRVTGHKSGITVPLIFRDECLGALMFTKNVADDFSADIKIIEAFAKQLTIAIRNSTLYNQVTEQVGQLGLQNAELTSLNDLTGNIVSVLDTDEVLKRTANGIPKELGYIGVIIGLFNDDHTEIRVEMVTENEITNLALNLLGKDMSEFPVFVKDKRYEHLLSLEAIRDDKTIISADFNSIFSPPIPKGIISNIVRATGIKSVGLLPLKGNTDVLGVVGFLLGKAPEDVAQGSVRFMEAFTHVLGIAVENSRSFAEKEKLLSELKKKVAELEEAARKEKDMLDILAHELRTPISTARNYYDQLAKAIQPIPDKIEPEKFEHYRETIKENIQREINLLETMLSSTKIDRNKVELDLQNVPLKEIADTMFESFEPESAKKKLQLTNDFEDVSLIVRADKERAIEVGNNLLSNAIKYTKEGEVKIYSQKKEGFYGITIEDTGEGIPEADIPNLGKKFYRANQHIDPTKDTSQTFTRPGGTGLGLYVSFGLVELMKGEVQVESEVGEGSKFTIWLPVAKKVS